MGRNVGHNGLEARERSSQSLLVVSKSGGGSGSISHLSRIFRVSLEGLIGKAVREDSLALAYFEGGNCTEAEEFLG